MVTETYDPELDNFQELTYSYIREIITVRESHSGRRHMSTIKVGPLVLRV